MIKTFQDDSFEGAYLVQEDVTPYIFVSEMDLVERANRGSIVGLAYGYRKDKLLDCLSDYFSKRWGDGANRNDMLVKGLGRELGGFSFLLFDEDVLFYHGIGKNHVYLIGEDVIKEDFYSYRYVNRFISYKSFDFILIASPDVILGSREVGSIVRDVYPCSSVIRELSEGRNGSFLIVER